MEFFDVLTWLIFLVCLIRNVIQRAPFNCRRASRLFRNAYIILDKV